MTDLKISIPPIQLPISTTQRKCVHVKIGMLGDAQVGKTTLMVKYVKNKFDITYIETFGINTMEKTINLQNIDVKLCLWELGGQREFSSLMPVVCCDARCILFIFDLTQRTTLLSIKRWYKEAKRENSTFSSFLIGTKFDLYEKRSNSYKIDITASARKFAKKMNAALIYCSSASSVNVRKIFKLVIAKFLFLKPRIKEQKDEIQDALIEYNKNSNHNHKNKNKYDNNKNKYDDNINKKLRNRPSTARPRPRAKTTVWAKKKIDKNKLSVKKSFTPVADNIAIGCSLSSITMKGNKKKLFKKRVKNVKLRLDLITEDKLQEIEKILGLSL